MPIKKSNSILQSNPARPRQASTPQSAASRPRRPRTANPQFSAPGQHSPAHQAPQPIPPPRAPAPPESAPADVTPGAEPPATARELLAACITRADWEAMVRKQVEQACDGSKPAFELLLEYAYGRPAPAPAAGDDDTPIQYIEVHEPATAGPLDPTGPRLPWGSEE